MPSEHIGDTIDSSTAVPGIQDFTFSKGLSFTLSIGKRFGPVNIAFKTFGELDPEKSNAVLVFPTLTATQQAATETIDGKTFSGWWPEIIGRKKPIDTEKFFVICADHFGGCYGSTGPSSKSPDTGKPYGMNFPPFFIRDMANCAAELVQHLGIRELHAMIGSSLGGLLALETIALFPGLSENAFIIGASNKISAEFIALNHIAREAIMLDPDWNNGNYYGKGFPSKGLSIARQIGNISYLNRALLDMKFGREAVGRRIRPFVSTMELQYQVESYLDHQGTKFSKRFDANSYIYLSKAIDTFDIGKEFGSINNAFSRAETNVNLVSISSDVLFPPEEVEWLFDKFKKLGKKASYTKINSHLGHDGLFLENEKLGGIIRKKI
ncbi:MAG: homoserine O-acetyltransferase [Candidatus ainarchaeum sp.]|nr:homoserine O-acetyltransferase [Candidatus ainarchaeum sp.]